MGKSYVLIGGEPDQKIYTSLLSARKAAYAIAKRTGSHVDIFGGYKRMTVEGQVFKSIRSGGAWKGKIFYEYFSESQRKWVKRRLSSDGKLHELYSEVKW